MQAAHLDCLTSYRAAGKKAVLAVYKSAPQMTMSARPKGKPKAPNSSFCTPGFCVLICTGTTVLRPRPVALQSPTPVVATKHHHLSPCIAAESPAADTERLTSGALSLHCRKEAHERDSPGLLGACSHQGKLSTNGVAQGAPKRQVDTGQDAQQKCLPPVHEALLKVNL